MSRIIVLDTERMKLLDEQVALERKNKELSKVCFMHAFMVIPIEGVLYEVGCIICDKLLGKR